MLIFQKPVFILLLASCITTYPSISTSTTAVVTSSSVIHHTETSTFTEPGIQSNVTGLSQTTQQLDSATEVTTHSLAHETGTLPSSETTSPSETPTTTSNLYTKLSEPTSNSFTATTNDANFTTMVTTNDTQTTNVTAPLDNTTSVLSLTTSNNAKTVVITSVKTTRLPSSLTKSSGETSEPRKDNHSNGGVIFGAIVGVVLGTALIGLAGYFMCKKRKSEGFVHQRLYDDTRNDPVLRLDNAPESYGDSFVDLSYNNPTTANATTAQNSNTPPYDAIPMDNMTLSPHIP